jgi:hypothetical protein
MRYGAHHPLGKTVPDTGLEADLLRCLTEHRWALLPLEQRQNSLLVMVQVMAFPLRQGL